MVEENGRAEKYEIVSLVEPSRKLKDLSERLYEARNISSGVMKTIAQEEVLRLATPVDSAAELFDNEGLPKEDQD